jgi:hypothetical protein
MNFDYEFNIDDYMNYKVTMDYIITGNLYRKIFKFIKKKAIKKLNLPTAIDVTKTTIKNIDLPLEYYKYIESYIQKDLNNIKKIVEKDGIIVMSSKLDKAIFANTTICKLNLQLSGLYVMKKKVQNVNP